MIDSIGVLRLNLRNFLLSELGVSLLDKGELDTLSSGKRNSGGLTVSNNLHVGDSSGEGVTLDVLHVHDGVGTGVSLDGGEDSDSSDVVSSSEHEGGSVMELDDSGHLLGLEIELKRSAFNNL